MKDMEPEGNVEIPGVDMERQEAPPQFVEINDANIPQDLSLNAPEVPAETDVPTQVSAPDTEGPLISTRVRSQPDAYAPSMTGKFYEYSMTQLDIQVVLHPDAHIFSQEYFYQSEPEVVIAIMNQLSLKAVFK